MKKPILISSLILSSSLAQLSAAEIEDFRQLACNNLPTQIKTHLVSERTLTYRGGEMDGQQFFLDVVLTRGEFHISDRLGHDFTFELQGFVNWKSKNTTLVGFGEGGDGTIAFQKEAETETTITYVGSSVSSSGSMQANIPISMTYFKKSKKWVARVTEELGDGIIRGVQVFPLEEVQ